MLPCQKVVFDLLVMRLLEIAVHDHHHAYVAIFGDLTEAILDLIFVGQFVPQNDLGHLLIQFAVVHTFPREASM